MMPSSAAVFLSKRDPGDVRASGLILEAGPWLDRDRIFANYRDGPYPSSPWAPHPNLTHVPLSLLHRATGARQL